jgi:hypothetical protein
MKISWKLGFGLAALVLAAIVCVGGIGLYGYANSLQMTGVSLEKQLNAQYLDNQNNLSSYISGFYEQVGIAQAAGSQLDTILTDAVKGRYDGKDGAAFGSDALFAAISEAYPDTSQLAGNWTVILDYIKAGRESYRNIQSKLLDMLRSYDTWRESGLVQSQIIRLMGYPSNGLVARIGTDKYTGQDALDKMYQIVLTKEALDAYNTGTMDPLQVPGAPARPTEAK